MPTLFEEFMAALDADAATPPTKVKINGWPELYLRSITVDEAEQQAKDLQDKKNESGGLSRAAARRICDAEGKVLGDWRDEAYVARLGRARWDKLQKLLAAADLADGADAGN